MTQEPVPGPLETAEIAHEIRNIVFVIHACVGLLRAHHAPRDPEAEQLLADLALGADRAAALAARLIGLARRSARAGDRTDVAEVVARKEAAIRRLAPLHVEVTADVADAPLGVRVPPHDVGDVLVNLALNAIDAMPDGGELTIDARRVTHGGKAHVALTVSDTGTGMDEETLRRCFEPFFTTKGERGSGIGLHVVRDVVERNGGRVVLTSAPRHGTSVCVLLPLLEED